MSEIAEANIPRGRGLHWSAVRAVYDTLDIEEYEVWQWHLSPYSFTPEPDDKSFERFDRLLVTLRLQGLLSHDNVVHYADMARHNQDLRIAWTREKKADKNRARRIMQDRRGPRDQGNHDWLPTKSPNQRIRPR